MITAIEARKITEESRSKLQKTIDEINYYIDEFNPLDKAGSYGIQELPDGYLDKYEGSFENIVGLAPESVEALLKQLEYNE